MDTIFQKITEWLKEMLVSGIMESLSGMFDSVNQQVSDVAAQVGTSPVNFSPGVFAMIRNVSESVIIPIAGLILTFIACYELIQLIIDHNNLANFETWIFFKWVFKTFVAALIGTYMEILILGIGMKIMSLIIFIIVYGRMIEIYLMTSLAPIPFSPFGNREQSQIGQNYLRSLFALGFQGFLIMICVGIYAVLIQGISFSGNILTALWGVMGYTVLLCFTLFKTGTLAKSVFNAH